MLVDATPIPKFRITTGLKVKVPKSLDSYSRYAYTWSIIAFIIGGALVSKNRFLGNRL